MKHVRSNLPFILCSIALAILAIGFAVLQPVQSAVPITGGISAKASGAVVANRFVKLTAVDTVAAATAATDAIIGVCELGAADTVITRYAPAGTITTVTASTTISAGAFITATTAGKAVTVTTNNGVASRFGGIALEAATAGDQEIRCLVCPGVLQTGTVTLSGHVELAANKNLTCLTGTTSVDMSLGTGTFLTSTGTNTLGGNVGISGSNTFDTGTGAVGILGTATVAANKNLLFTAGTGYIQIGAQTSGALKFLPAATSTSTTTVVTGNAAAATTVTLPRVTSQLTWTPGGGTTRTAAGAVPITHSYVAGTSAGGATAWTLANGLPGQIITIKLVTDGGGDATLTPATSTSIATIVFADAGDVVTLLYVDDTVGWVMMGAAGLADAGPAYTSPA